MDVAFVLPFDAMTSVSRHIPACATLRAARSPLESATTESSRSGTCTTKSIHKLNSVALFASFYLFFLLPNRNEHGWVTLLQKTVDRGEAQFVSTRWAIRISAC